MRTSKPRTGRLPSPPELSMRVMFRFAGSLAMVWFGLGWGRGLVLCFSFMCRAGVLPGRSLSQRMGIAVTDDQFTEETRNPLRERTGGLGKGIAVHLGDGMNFA